MQRRTMMFCGNVQGVGFRYTTCMVARSFEVTGYVRNAVDGTVEAVVEGADDEIDRFAAEVNDQMRSYVRRVEQRTEPATGEFLDFGVRF